MSPDGRPEERGEGTLVLDGEPLDDAEAIALRDARWRDEVFRPNEAQLTVRAVLTGALLGAVLSIADLYIGLRIGWTFGMSITASVLAFAIWSGARRAIPGQTELTLLENNTSQTVASAAAYMASAGLVASIPAMVILARDGVIPAVPLDGMRLVLWLLAISVLGVFVAVPLKRSLINAEQLRFPHGLVAAQTLQILHRAGSAGASRARALLSAGGVAAGWKLLCDAKLGIPAVVSAPLKLAGFPLRSWGLGFDSGWLFYAAGAVVGMRVGVSLLLGTIAAYVVLGPWLLTSGVLTIAPSSIAHDPLAAKAFVKAAEAVHAIPLLDPATLHVALRSKWTVWPGTAMMLGAALVSLVLRFRTFGRAFGALGALLRRGEAAPDALADVEVAPATFGAGIAAASVACIYMQWAWFGVPLALGALSVLLAFVLSIVAARSTGETGITPISALGKVTQLTFGIFIPGDAVANLMTATVTAGSAAHASDLMTEVKTGYLLGGSPRKQLWAQLAGVLVGALACVPIYLIVVRPETIGTTLPAPSAVAWASVAKVLKQGLGGLPRFAPAAAVVWFGVGVVIGTAESMAKGERRALVPSASAIGIGMMIDGYDAMTIFAGALLALAWQRTRPQSADAYRVVTASGIIAGEGLMGVIGIAVTTLRGH